MQILLTVFQWVRQIYNKLEGEKIGKNERKIFGEWKIKKIKIE